MDKSDIRWQLVEETTDSDAASPGQRLRAARERIGWSLEWVADELKLPPQRLAELEADEFAGFGPPVFVRGYLRRTAILLGVPPEEVLALYEAQTGAGAPPVRIGLAPGRPPRPDRSGWLGTALVGSLVAAVLAGGWWFLGPGPGESVQIARAPEENPGAPLALEEPGPEATAQAVPVQSAPERIAPARIEPEPASPATADGTPIAQPAPTSGEAGTAGDPSEVAATVADSLAAADSAPTVPSPAAEPPVVLAGQADIRIRLLEDCWLEIIDAEGRRLAYRLGRAGENTRVRGTAPVSVFLGNAEGVELTVDGEAVAVRPAARRDGTARLTVGGGAG